MVQCATVQLGPEDGFRDELVVGTADFPRRSPWRPGESFAANGTWLGHPDRQGQQPGALSEFGAYGHGYPDLFYLHGATQVMFHVREVWVVGSQSGVNRRVAVSRPLRGASAAFVKPNPPVNAGGRSEKC